MSFFGRRGFITDGHERFFGTRESPSLPGWNSIGRQMPSLNASASEFFDKDFSDQRHIRRS